MVVSGFMAMITPRSMGPVQRQALIDFPAVSPADVRATALMLLSRREYSRFELESKLEERYGKDISPLVTEVLDSLKSEGLQSDVRFVELLLQARRHRGCGPLRIAQELKQKGVAVSIFTPLLDAGSESWFALAHSVRIKKFGERLPLGVEERARQQRFLQYRGFTPEQIRQAF